MKWPRDPVHCRRMFLSYAAPLEEFIKDKTLRRHTGSTSLEGLQDRRYERVVQNGVTFGCDLDCYCCGEGAGPTSVRCLP